MPKRPDLARLRDKAGSLLRDPGKIFALFRCAENCIKLREYIEQYTVKSLANRILALQFAWAIIVYLFVIAALWFATSLVIENSVRHQGEGWIVKLDELGIPIYASNDPAQLNDAIAYIRNFPEVLQAQYLDVSGKKITASYSRKDTVLSRFSPLDDSAIDELKQVESKQKFLRFEKGDNSQMRISAPIWIKSIQNDGMIDFSLKNKTGEKIETIGFIDLVLDYSPISTELNRNLAYASVVIAAMMIIAAYIGRKIVHWALKPLSSLEEPLTRLANGETDVIVSSTGDREIARIGIALNTTIGALKERDEALRRMANHDGLTGLANRKYFVEELEKEVNRIAASGGGSALFFFDLDRFKFINDTYGHAAGDRLLIQIAKQLTQRIRGNDLVARFGGDEFTLLAYNVNKNSAKEIAESFIQLMRDFSFFEAGEMLKIHFSIGITLMDDSATTAQDLLKEADSAVHEAKTHGRNCYRIYQRTRGSNTQESGTGWHKRLQDALLHEQIIPYFQPLIGLKNQSEHIHEALLRLPDIEQGVIRPGAFMPAAERFGMMADFDRQMIIKVAEVLSVQNDPNLVFSLNLSERFIEQEGILEFLKEIVAEHHVSPKHFIFELPEQLIVRNFDKLKELIPALSALDFRFAVDDFGAGFGSFNYIKQFPVHFLKIDSSLIENVASDSIDRISVNSIVDIAASLNMQTIAKFVPDKKSLGLLKKLGVDYAQGNFIAEPSATLGT